MCLCSAEEPKRCPYREDFLEPFRGHKSQRCSSHYPDISNCTCKSIRSVGQLLCLVDCSKIMRWSIPKTVPVNTTHLSLEYGYYDRPKNSSALEANSFSQLSNLIYLDLRHMALFYLKSGTFNGLYKLKVLLLGYNYLHLMDSLDEDVLLPVAQSLQYLDLLIDYPPIASSKYLKNLTSLQSIVISYTGLGTFGEQFANMNNLVEIIIPKCAAQVLDNEAFQFLPQI